MVLGTDGRYTALAPEPVGIPGSLIAKLRQETGGNRVRLRWVRFSDWRPGLLCRACWHIELPHPASQSWKRRVEEFLSRLRQARANISASPVLSEWAFKGRRKNDLFHCFFWTLGAPSRSERLPSSAGVMCSLLPCGAVARFRCGSLTAPSPRCWFRGTPLLPRRTQRSATAGFPRARAAARATGAKGESSGRHFSVGLTATTVMLANCLK